MRSYIKEKAISSALHRTEGNLTPPRFVHANIDPDAQIYSANELKIRWKAKT